MKNQNSDIILFQYKEGEELGHALIHFLGILFGVFVLAQTLFNSKHNLGHYLWSGPFLFSLGLIAVYTSSTFYHLAKNPNRKLFLKKCDHASIYILIAGSYTPFLLVLFNRYESGLALFALFAVWVLAIMGVIFKFKARQKHLMLSVASYLALGWVSLVLMNEMKNSFSEDVLFAIMLGGFFYTFGVIFYLMKKMPYHHAIWHVFVLFGSFSHYFAIIRAIRTF